MGDDGRTDRPPRDTAIDKKRSLDYSGGVAKRFKVDEEEFDCIFTMLQEKIFAELKDENILRKPNKTILPDHMKDKTKLCMFHNDYGHTLTTYRNLYTQLRAMMRKGQLLKYLKKKVSLGSIERPGKTERVVVKTTDGGVTKDPGTSGSAQNLKIVTFIRKYKEEKDRQYDKYAARREKRNLRIKALGWYVIGISDE